uniref:Uncharacterized protein n=1 Tax=Panagrolaimus sp. PS1159 TaxID=55785 RepID=A0AC35GMP9_9BILA
PSARAKKRGRPKKIAGNEQTPRSNETASAQSSTRAELYPAPVESSSDPVNKKERPKKIVKYEQTPRMTTRSMVKAAAAFAPVRKRGRPKKNFKNESTSAEPVKKKRRTKQNVGGAPTLRLTTRSIAKAAATSVEPSSAHVIDSTNSNDMNEPQTLSTDNNPFVDLVAEEVVDESEFVVGQIYTDGSGVYALYNGECFVQVDPSKIEVADLAPFSSSDASNEESYCPLSNSDTVSEEEMKYYYYYRKPLNEVSEQPQQNDYMIMPTTVEASSFSDNFISPASTILDTAAAEEYKQPEQEEEINDEGYAINFNSSEDTVEVYDSFDPYNQPTCNSVDESFNGSINAFNLFGRENAADLLDLAFWEL